MYFLVNQIIDLNLLDIKFVKKELAEITCRQI